MDPRLPHVAQEVGFRHPPRCDPHECHSPVKRSEKQRSDTHANRTNRTQNSFLSVLFSDWAPIIGNKRW